jgi:hypothetical protein
LVVKVGLATLANTQVLLVGRAGDVDVFGAVQSIFECIFLSTRDGYSD